MKPFPLTATLTRCHDGQALIVLESEPFKGLEIRPHDLAALAERLAGLAAMAKRLPMSAKHFRPTKVQIGKPDAAIKAPRRPDSPSAQSPSDADDRPPATSPPLQTSGSSDPASVTAPASENQATRLTRTPSIETLIAVLHMPTNRHRFPTS